MARSRRSAQHDSPSFLWRMVKWAFVLGLWACLLMVGVMAWYARELPNIIENPKFKKEVSITVLANDGSVIGRYGDLKGNTLSIDDIPDHTINAVLATEDRRFYHHFGIDPIGLTRAIVVNLRSSKRTQGGSTITQQLAKNLFLTQDKTYKRKIQEALLALWLEKELTKDEILMAYLNRVYMGAGTYGIEAATRVFYNKPVKDLTLYESAVLAGLLKAPSRYSPLSNRKASHERGAVVIGAMLDAGVITEKQAKDALSRKPVKAEEDGDSTGPSSRYFADWIVDTLDNVIGTPKQDLIVETTLDPEVQEGAAAVLKDTVQKNIEKLRVSQGASIILRPDGSIVGMVGGIDYKKSQYNRTTQGMRQPGSSFKPIVYLAALEKGFTPYDLVVDEPITEGRYRPQNFGNKYYGELTLLEALTYSLNTVSVRLAKAVGIENVISVARRMGITADLEPSLALSLGSSEVSMLEMAQAYATIASGGHAIKAFGIKKIETKEGKTLYEYKQEAAPKVFRSSDIDGLVTMMASVVQNGTGGGAAGVALAGKTGTTQDHRDAWFDGFSNDYVAVVWFGNDDNKPMKGVTGGGLAAGTWKRIISAAKSDPTPSKYKVMKSYDFADEFGDLIGRIMSDDRPPMDNETKQPGFIENLSTRPTFRPDRAGDRVGYSRMND
jgi:penicillin-binding protein 1A